MASETSTSASLKTLPVFAAAAPIRSPRERLRLTATRERIACRSSGLIFRHWSGSALAIAAAESISSFSARVQTATQTFSSRSTRMLDGSMDSVFCRFPKISVPPTVMGILRGSSPVIFSHLFLMDSAHLRLPDNDQSVSGSLTNSFL